MAHPRYYTTASYAEAYGMNQEVVRRKCASGQIPAVWKHNQWRIPFDQDVLSNLGQRNSSAAGGRRSRAGVGAGAAKHILRPEESERLSAHTC